jgi:predicted NodU family carbamoyl transferase
MDILGYKSGGHDGTVCYLQDGRLVFSIEGEKDSGYRHALLDHEQLWQIVDRWGCEPHILCGDSRQFAAPQVDNYVGYQPENIELSHVATGGGKALYVSVPHEMSHVACSFALSDLPERQPFYALVWEGLLGRLYHVDANFRITKLGEGDHILDRVGSRYSFPYHGTGRSDICGHAAAGKIMALAAYAKSELVNSPEVREFVDELLSAELTIGDGRVALNGDVTRLYERFSHLCEVSVMHPQFVAICKALQESIFERFLRFARLHVSERLPLLISGGCGLNCDWNTMWRDSGVFESVFVPPVPNDCGIAIGAAALVQYLETKKMKVAWDVYAGEEFVNERTDFAAAGFIEMPLNYAILSEWLLRWEMVVAWVQGRYEIGPRALCHRSLLAAPFSQQAQSRLNTIKNREMFRPVAPVCLEDEVSKHFEWNGASPHMLYFQKVRSRELEAVTHVDRTARVQTITRAQDRRTAELLEAFRAKSGFGVLCNTSLNLLGRGFINRTSDLVRYMKETNIPAMVIEGRMYVSESMHARIERGH